MRITLKNPPPAVLTYLQGYALNSIIQYVNMPPECQAWITANAYVIDNPALLLWKQNQFWKVIDPVAGTIRTLSTTRKKVTERAHKKRPRIQYRQWEQAVDYLVKFLTLVKKKALPPGFSNQQLQNLRKGYFDPEYWEQCDLVKDDTLMNVPTSSAFTGIRNYAYPDPLNSPTKATYGDGTLTSGYAGYSGSTLSGFFYDNLLKWQRLIYDMKTPLVRGDGEPVFAKITGSVHASANVRPSRAMVSAIIKRSFTSATSPNRETVAPPTTKPISALYRYKTPRGVAPYFNLTNQLRLIYYLRSTKFEEAGVDLESATVLIAPMPMMGKRYNNNTQVDSTLTVAVELWQVKREPPIMGGWGDALGNGIAFIYDPATNPDPYSLTGGETITDQRLQAISRSKHACGLSMPDTGLHTSWYWSPENGFQTIMSPSGSAYVYAWTISADGTTVFGDSQAGTFSWTPSGGMVLILPSSGQGVFRPTCSNLDGSIIAGTDGRSIPSTAVTMSMAGYLSVLQPMAGHIRAFADDISLDGHTVSGRSYDGSAYWPVIWFNGGAPTSLSAYTDTHSGHRVKISGDGKVACGTSFINGAYFAWRYTPSEGQTFLTSTFPVQWSIGNTIDGEGTHVMGWIMTETNTGWYIWKKKTGMVFKSSPLGMTSFEIVAQAKT